MASFIPTALGFRQKRHHDFLAAGLTDVAGFVLQRLPIAEALLDQSVVAGIGNIAKSEILFSAGIHPRAKMFELGGGETPRLLTAIHEILWGSYHNGGCWKCSIYRKAGEKCINCGRTIRSIRQPPSRRTTYFCPKYQK